jgi:peptidoglycan hydrolase CwlO-like protein
MKRFLLSSLIILAAVGCGKTETTSQTEKGTDTSKKVDVEFSYDKKPEFVAKLKSELANVNNEIKNLGDKIAASTEKAKTEAQPKLDQLKEQAKTLDVQIDKAENATAETWEEVKAGSKKALEDVKAGFNDARAWVSEKIAPK